MTSCSPPVTRRSVDMDRSAAVLDLEHLARSTGGDASLMAELLAMLRRELPARRNRLDAALAEGDLDEAAEVAHKLQGSAAYTGAFGLEAAAARLEDRLRKGDPDGLDDARAALAGAIEALERVLEAGVAVSR